jgi:hypothetical protein
MSKEYFRIDYTYKLKDGANSEILKYKGYDIAENKYIFDKQHYGEGLTTEKVLITHIHNIQLFWLQEGDHIVVNGKGYFIYSIAGYYSHPPGMMRSVLGRQPLVITLDGEKFNMSELEQMILYER